MGRRNRYYESNLRRSDRHRLEPRSRCDRSQFPHGCWCLRGMLAEDGLVDGQYRLAELRRHIELRLRLRFGRDLLPPITHAFCHKILLNNLLELLAAPLFWHGFDARADTCTDRGSWCVQRRSPRSAHRLNWRHPIYPSAAECLT
jgi:hypothetical protein